ncbi:hypothetical protein ATO6_15950 [Oceanicola sp. 22II-s10i]|nr:hypothetical protein ATO6_15950 [Oceanicola sp. 22II-s10i]
MTAFEPGFGAAADDLIWNGRKPGVRARYIVRAANVADVQTAVRFAAANGFSVSPRSSGHHFTGISTQATVVIDLEALNHLRIDAEAMVCEAGPTVTNARLNAELTARGLAFPVGHCASVAIGGYLLGGGVGWNSGEWGIACFLIESVDIVTPDGVLRRVSATEEPDLFWAARGAGPGFFGIVTSYRLRVKKAKPAIMSAVRVYGADHHGAVSGWVRQAIRRAPANLELSLKVSTEVSPVGPMVAIAVIATAFGSSEAESRAILSEFGRGAPAGAFIEVPEMPTSIAGLYDMTGAGTPKGHRFAVDSLWSDAPVADVLAGIVATMQKAPSAKSFAVLSPSSPAAAVPGEAAFSRIGSIFGAIYTVWQDEEQDARQIGWLRSGMDSLQPLKAGVYVGYGDIDVPARRKEIHSRPAELRLAEMRRRYDPRGLFGQALGHTTSAQAA